MGKWNKTTPNYNVQQCYYYYIYRSHTRTIAIDSPRQVSKSDFTAWWHETNFTEAYCSKIHTKVITRISKYLNLICLQMYVNLLIEMYEKGTTHHRQQVWLFRYENAQYRKLAIFLPLWFYVKLTLADIKISHFDHFYISFSNVNISQKSNFKASRIFEIGSRFWLLISARLDFT